MKNRRTTLQLIGVAALYACAASGCSGQASASAEGAAASGSAGSADSRTALAGGVAGGDAAPQQGKPDELGTGTFDDLINRYRSKCSAQALNLDCEILRSLVVAEMTTALTRLERSGDQRAVPLALRALDALDEPEVTVAAARVLGHFPETPNLAAKMVPFLLDSLYLAVQNIAAKVLAANSQEAWKDLGQLWLDNHGTIRSETSRDDYPDFPSHYAALGFPKYPKAEWFSPADSDRSIGWSTADDVSAVAKWFGDTLHAEVMTPETWNDIGIAQSQIPIKALMDPARTTRMQQLMDRIMKGDQAAQAEFDKMQKEAEEAGRKAGEAAERSIVQAAYGPSSFLAASRWIVLKKQGERITQLIVVFPVSALKRTAIKYVWDLSDYPSAWPPPSRAASAR